MVFARRVFFWAGIYGFVVLMPNFFLEKRIGLDIPPAITHPEYFYGFLSLALTFQLLFLIIARDPVRYRPIMLPAIFEKFGFASAAWALFLLGRMSWVVLVPVMGDILLGTLFVIAYRKTPASVQ